MDIFAKKGIRPMRFHKTCAPFNSDDWIYELKLSGIRCLAYLNESGTDLRNPQNVPLLPVFPELKNLHLQAKQPCILDGILLVLINGSADQEELCHRFHSSESVGRIHAPVSYVAFDLLYQKDHMTTGLPLIQRKALLEDTIQETVDIAVSRTMESHGIELFELALKENLDGVVAKRKDSIYQMDAFTPDWVQFLAVPAGYYIICGYLPAENGSGCLLLGQYSRNVLVFKGYLRSSAFDSGFVLDDFIIQASLKHRSDCPFTIRPVFPSDQQILWFEPATVCKVELQNNNRKDLEHAKFLRIVKNMPANECFSFPTARR